MSNFEPYLGWQDVVDPENPQPGAKRITSNDLLRYEEGIERNENIITQVIGEIPEIINTGLSTISEGYAESAVWPDVNSEGLYFFRQGGQLVESDIPGLYEIDPNKTPLPSYEIPPGVAVFSMEEGNTYSRPTDSPEVVVIFTGYTDPGTVAVDGDRWEKLIAPVPAGGRTGSTFLRKNGAWI